MRFELVFALPNVAGSLESVLQIFKDRRINLEHIESRPSRTSVHEYEFLLSFNVKKVAELEEIVEKLKFSAQNVRVISTDSEVCKAKIEAIPWFPRHIRDLDQFAHKTLEFGSELSADHPGFNDLAYRKRRAEIVSLSKSYKWGQPIPEVQYTNEEIATWKKVFTQIKELLPTHACKEYLQAFPLLERNCGYGPDSIPQLETVSQFLRQCTGFSLRPVAGLLSPRDFLNGLAFRVFHSTQYIRHPSKPFYTPEPDVCHELLGHVPLFANQEFAAFSQEIGLASLGASEEDIKKLATIYWFTVEFGLCREEGGIKAYGAGLLSSFGELEYCLSQTPKLLDFECKSVSLTEYPITEYQPTYFVADGFGLVQRQIQEYSRTLVRPFMVRYDPYTQMVEVLDSKAKIMKLAQSIQNDFQSLIDCFDKFPIQLI